MHPGCDTRHIDWAAQAIVDYRPDVLVHIGDHWDMPSLSSYDKPGSLRTEGARIKADIDAGNEAMERLMAPTRKEQARLKKNKERQWNLEAHFTFGNHEERIVRAVSNEPKLEGLITLDMLDLQGLTPHPFLEIVPIDGIWYSHYFSNTQSGRPVGGTIPNRLNKIGNSFVHGHQQGRLEGSQQYPGKLIRYGLVCGSFYLHDEHYRDAQSNGEWRGIIVLNEVDNGTYDIMPLSMKYLQRKYG